jgi:hypothetical protein
MTKSVGFSVRPAKRVFSLSEAIGNDQMTCVRSVITAGMRSHQAIRLSIFQLRDTHYFESMQQIPMWVGKGSAVCCNAKICLAGTYCLCNALRIHRSDEHALNECTFRYSHLDLPKVGE